MKLTKFDHVLSFELLDIGNPEDDPDDMEPQYVDNSQRIFPEYRTFLSIYRRACRRHYLIRGELRLLQKGILRISSGLSLREN